MKNLHTLCTMASVAIALFAMMAMLLIAGCGGNDAPTGPVLMAVIPSVGGVDANNIYGIHWSGPAGKYSFRLVAGIGTPVTMKGSPTEPPYDTEYAIYVWQVSSATASYLDDPIRAIVPDSTGQFDLSPPGFYQATAYELGQLDVATVAECWVTTESPPQ